MRVIRDGTSSNFRPMKDGDAVATRKSDASGSVAMGSFVAFEACDEGNKGYLNREDYKVAVVMLFGYKPSKTEVDSVMASVYQSQSGISLDEFLNLMSTKKAAQLYHNEARHLFTAFDVQCKGFLSLEDFKAAFRIVAPKLPERTIVEAFREVDQDSDGHISFREFESAMNYGRDDLSALPFT